MQYKLHCKASDAAVGVPAIARSHCKSLTEAWRWPEGNNKPRCGRPAGPCKGGAPNHSVDACDIAEWLRLAVEATVAPRSSSPFRENWLLGTVARDGRSSQLGKPASATRAAAEHNNQTTCFAATRLPISPAAPATRPQSPSVARTATAPSSGRGRENRGSCPVRGRIRW